MKKNVKLIASLSLMLAAATVNAQEFIVDPIVINPDGSSTIKIYIDIPTAMDEYGGISCSLRVPTGYELDKASAKLDPVFASASLPTATVNKRGVGKFSVSEPTCPAGKQLFATIDVKAVAGATNDVFQVTDAFFRIYEDEVNYTDYEPENTSIDINVLNDLTISPVGFSTYSACAAVKVTGATVYTGVINGDVLTLTEVAGGIVPGNTGVLLGGTAGATVTLEPSEEEGSVGGNALVSSKDAKMFNSILALGGDNNNMPFFGAYDVNDIQPNKAYLPNDALLAPIRINFGGNSIESINAENNVEFNYNLMGQQMKVGKGVVISNGKKTFQK